MKVPVTWLKDYVKTTKSIKDISKSFTSLGLMLDKPISDNVLDLEHRFDRSDWLAILGCARDFAAFEGLELIYPKTHIQKGKPATSETRVEIKVEVSELVKRFNTRIFKNIKVKESPEWLKERLTAYGMPTINNVVDITNFVMVEYGQPMHAQDLGKFQKREILIRKAKNGENIVTLDGTTIKLDQDIFVLTQNNKPIAIGGVVGGKETSVTESTTEIILDSGSYDQSNIRKTARKLKIQNETVLRYDKFLHPHANQLAIERAAQLILELCGGDYYENEDYYPNPPKVKRMNLTYSRIKMLSGMDIDQKKVKAILIALEYKILQETETGLTLEIPFFRTDIEVEDDIVSDVLRIGDYENIPSSQINSAPPDEITPNIYKYEEKLRDALVNLGLHEHITDPLTQFINAENQLKIQNSFNPEKNALRTSISQTLQEVVSTYKKHSKKEIGIFEIGLVYLLSGDKYMEHRHLDVIFEKHGAGIHENSDKLKQILSGLFLAMGIEDMELVKSNNSAKIHVNKKEIGELRHNSFTIFTRELSNVKQKRTRVIDELVNTQTADLSVRTPVQMQMGPILREIERFGHGIIGAEIRSSEIVDSDEKSVLFRFTLTASTTPATQVVEMLTNHLEKHFKIKVLR